MKFGVVVFPGSNCDEDVYYVLRHTLNQNTIKLWHKSHNLEGCDFIILPGGFSYGDYLRSGAIAKVSPIMKEVTQFAEKGGFVFGICNGFQILCEAELLPGALLHNSNHRFICKNVFIKASNTESVLTAGLETRQPLMIPIAHGEGKYYADKHTLDLLNNNQQVLFRYCSESGEINSESNPNGSLENIAGICNEGKNVFGMMPHPERASSLELNNTDGLQIFKSILSQVAVSG